MDRLNETLLTAILHNDFKSFKRFLKKGINVNKICSTGTTLLGTAAQMGNVPMVKLLIENSNCFNLKNDEGAKSNHLQLDLTTEKKYKNIGYFVVRKDSEDNEFGEGPTPEGMEALEWDMEVDEASSPETGAKSVDMNIYHWYANILHRSSIVLKSPNNDIARLDSHGRNVLHYAVQSGNIDLVRFFVDNFDDINVNQSDAASVSPLHIATTKCHLPLVRYLVEKGANVNNTCRERRTSLHIAAQFGFLEIMQFLIEHGAQVNIFDLKDRSPLSLAVLKCKEDSVKMLIRHGARLNHEDATGFIALRHAVVSDSTLIATLLLQAGAKVVQSHHLMHAAARNNNVEILRALHEAGALLNIRDERGNTPLMVACSRKNLQVAKYLLKNGANVNTANNINGMTALHICVQDIREARSLQQFIELLILYGADMNATSYQGSVLFYSIILNNLRAAAALVRHGVDVNLRDERAYFDNLSLAKRHGNLELVKLIVFAGFQMSNLAFDLKSLRLHPGDEAHEFLVAVKSSPLQLRELSRIAIRKRLGCNLIDKLYQLPLPGILHQYLALEVL